MKYKHHTMESAHERFLFTKKSPSFAALTSSFFLMPRNSIVNKNLYIIEG